MKRIGFLYEKICDRALLKVAMHKASCGKKKRSTVKRVLENEEKHLDILEKILKDETYHPLGYTKKTIKDKGSGKEREIFVPRFFPDQVVQWALILVIKPILMRGMYDFSCASIDRRGASLGIKALKKWLSHDPKRTKYCLKTDIRKFYPSVDQEILMQKFERKIKCQKTLNLISKIVHSTESGLPIGNVTSQWFANFYLQDFDHYAKEQLKIPYYIRYMDDMVFLSSNRRKLMRQEKIIENYLANEKLTIKPNFRLFKVGNCKYVPKKARKANENCNWAPGNDIPIDFLGYQFYRNFVRIRARTFLRLTRRIRKTHKRNYLSVLNAQAIISYMARINVASGNKLYKIYVKPLVSIGYCKHRVSRHDKALAKARKKMASECIA